MPPATALQFYRKSQTIDHLALERPQSLQSFRESVRGGLSVIEARFDLLRQSYFGNEGDVEQEIRQWIPVFTTVMKEAKISTYSSKRQLQHMLEIMDKLQGDPTFVTDIDRQSLLTVVQYLERCNKYIRFELADVVKEVKRLLDYVNIYCLSFSGTEGDKYLETAVCYERQRRDFERAITFSLNSVVDLADNFDKNSLSSHNFGLAMKKLAEKAECMHILVLLMVPQAFEHVKNACQGIRQWLIADEDYDDYIQFDIIELEEKKDHLLKTCRESQVKCSNHDHRIKIMKRDFAKCAEDLKRFSKRSMVLAAEKEQLLEQHRNVRVDLDIKIIRRDEMTQSLEEMNTYERDRYDRLLLEIGKLKEEKPILDKKLEDISKKIEIIEKLQEDTNKKETQLTESVKEARVAKKEHRLMEVELERMEASILKLKEIHRYKTSAEVLKKIFYNMPITTKHVVISNGRKPIDKLERAIRITATKIDGDWPRLYWSLPFHPPRGEETIRADIDEIGKTYMRRPSEELCKQCLWRWRRVHTRTSLNELKKALLVCKRKDIADLIDQKMSKKRKPSVASRAVRTVRFPKLPVKV
ncbi:hypothetical protein CHS0354_017858 [Potamilus streckersoni]|uniref:Death domain-containing protein n=1 Tax=Potamilus streckersoni TaxID=2493646 RepID=A0AAE0T6W7_9BIVA|nr:hypothetical protein CHS0354_017858 [Potamilus streckersoni]